MASAVRHMCALAPPAPRCLSRAPAATPRRIARRPTVRAMLLEHLPQLEGHRVVLASASPRRRELLQQMGMQFEVGAGWGAIAVA